MQTLRTEAGDQNFLCLPLEVSLISLSASVKPYSDPESGEGGGLEQPPCKDQPQPWSLCHRSHPLKDQQHCSTASISPGPSPGLGPKEKTQPSSPSPKIPVACNLSHHPGDIQESFALLLELLTSPLTWGCQAGLRALAKAVGCLTFHQTSIPHQTPCPSCANPWVRSTGS